jgi:hypothetical protein
VLPEPTVRSIDRIVRPGERSRFIDLAVQHFIVHCGAEALRTQLEQAAIRDRDLDREIAADWFAVDQDGWQRLDTPERKKRHSRGAAKSTSRRSTRR